MDLRRQRSHRRLIVAHIRQQSYGTVFFKLSKRKSADLLPFDICLLISTAQLCAPTRSAAARARL
jgi:hypothetical protein